jgi:rhodanese-related sulfurtransferase
MFHSPADSPSLLRPLNPWPKAGYGGVASSLFCFERDPRGLSQEHSTSKVLRSPHRRVKMSGSSISNLSPWPRVLRETIIILIISFSAGLGFNLVRSERLPLIADWTAEGRLKAQFGEHAVIPFKEAEQEFFSKKGVFLDARPPLDYRAGHIRRARNLPIEAFDEHFDSATGDLPQESLIITYCDGETCTEGAMLAKKLKEMGYENVRILVNGWSLWRQHNLPIDQG